MSSLTGFSPNNPKKYLGPNVALTVVVTVPREPTGADIRQPTTGKYYSFGTLWLVGKNPTTGTYGDLWYLAYIESNVGVWKRLAASYSTGTWTPNLQINGLDTGITYTNQTAGYTQVGNAIHFWIDVVLSSKGVQTGIVSISNLPVITSSTALQYVPVNLYNGLTAASYTTLSLQLLQNSNRCFFELSDVKAAAVASQVIDTNISDTFHFNTTGVYFTD